MTLSGRVKTAAGRWFDAHYLPPSDVPAPLPVPAAGPLVLAEEPHSTPRAACTLQRGERVFVSGHWWAPIARIEVERSSQGPAQVLLHLESGTIFGSRFDQMYVSRDADEQALAATGGAL